MNYKIISSITFLKNAKKLSKQYPSFKGELKGLCVYIVESLYSGRQISNNCYIIRMGIFSKKIGKFGGERVQLSIKIVKDIVYLLSVNDIGGFNDDVDVWLKEVDFG